MAYMIASQARRVLTRHIEESSVNCFCVSVPVLLSSMWNLGQPGALVQHVRCTALTLCRITRSIRCGSEHGKPVGRSLQEQVESIHMYTLLLPIRMSPVRPEIPHCAGEQDRLD